MKASSTIPCPLYCLRILRHLIDWLAEPGPQASFDSVYWWEIGHYWYSKHPSAQSTAPA